MTNRMEIIARKGNEVIKGWVHQSAARTVAAGYTSRGYTVTWVMHPVSE